MGGLDWGGMTAAGALGLVWAQKSRWLLSSCWEEDSHSRVLKKKKAPLSVQDPGQFCPSSILSWFVNNNDYSPCPPDSPKSSI